MAQSEHPETRNFVCEHCGGEIRIPYVLPPTKGPCPHCEEEILSPGPPEEPVAAEPEAEVPAYDVEAGVTGESPPPVPTVPAAPAEEVAIGPVVLRIHEESGGDEAVEEIPELPPVIEDEVVEAASDPEADAGAVTEPIEEAPAEPVQPAESPQPPRDEDLAELEEDEAVAEPAASKTRIPAALVVFMGLGLLLVGMVVVGVYLLRSKNGEPPMKQLNRELVERNRFLREGWKPLATEQLRGFLKATTVEEKAQYVMGGASKVEAMRAFYGDGEIDESDTPLTAFIHHELELKDRSRGIFLMRYERPAQFNIREFFRPVAPLEVQYRVEEPGLLLSSFAMLDNFAMEPVRVLAFFKQDGDKLLLDWDVYAQTKYRVLKDFSSLPRPGERRTLRVIIQEDIPDYLLSESEGLRYYRLSEPSNADDFVKVPVEESSPMGRTLAGLNWIGKEVENPPKKTATVELEWTSGPDPQLQFKEFICWEFVGLGGDAAVPGSNLVGPDATANGRLATPVSTEQVPAGGDEAGPTPGP